MMMTETTPTLPGAGAPTARRRILLVDDHSLLPDVIVLDFSMPRMDGLQATRILRREFPEVRIVALSMYEKADRAEAMLAAGANAYVEKNGRAEQLLEAIRGG
jgi:DNA-binding NarL/FixJ family response regulator